MHRLAGRKYGPWACWVTGWLNLLGQIAAVSAVSALLADLTSTMIYEATGLNGGTPVELNKYQYFGLFACFILLDGIFNSLGMKWLTLMTQIGAVFNIAGVILLCIVVPAVAVEHRTPKFVFQGFVTGPAKAAGIANPL